MSDSVRVRWWIKDTLLAYMMRDPGFLVEASGGASFDPIDGLVLPVERATEGGLRATGSISLRAHGGALSVELVDAHVDADALWITSSRDGEPDRMRLVTLHATGATAYETRLAPEADLLFLYNYVPGTPFGSLQIEAG